MAFWQENESRVVLMGDTSFLSKYFIFLSVHLNPEKESPSHISDSTHDNLDEAFVLTRL